MKKKFVYISLLLGMMAFATSCSSKKTQEASEPKETEIAVDTEAPTFTPLPTAEVIITKQEDGTSLYQNQEGYQVAFDGDKFESINKNDIDSFTPGKSDKKAKKELDLFFNVVHVKSGTADELNKQLKSAHKKKYKKESVTLGTEQITATKYVITEVDKTLRHEYYVVDADNGLWLVELKCPKKYKEKYGTAMNEMLDSLAFTKTQE